MHKSTGHTGYYRLYKEIILKKYYWKGIIEDCKDTVNNCIDCIKLRGGAKFKLCPKQIITKGAKERYVADGWQLHTELVNVSGFKWVIDIIDHFSKFMASYPIEDNNAINVLNAIKEFCMYVGYPKILQTDNGLEYNNEMINNLLFIKSHNSYK